MDDLRDAWERDGYVVLRGAAAVEAIAAYPSDLARVHDGLLVRGPGDEHVSLAIHATNDRPPGAIDPYAISPVARALLLPAAVTTFLTARFGDDAPLLFDAAGAAAGSPEPAGTPYRDATFVALATEPETLVTIAVALGESPVTVTVFPGSQKIPTRPFSGRYRHVNPERDGEAALQRHRDELAAALGDDAESDTITLSPGDVLIWSADLVHGAIEGAALIAHLCPTRVQPGWFAYRPERARHASYDDGSAWIASQHYDLVDALAPEQALANTDENVELERVEDALREHDADNAAPTQTRQNPPTASGLGRRGGGLVDSVRGLMNRRGR
jgi:hypothetical protein